MHYRKCEGADTRVTCGRVFQDLDMCLHGQSAVPPLLLLYAAEIGLSNCFKCLATTAVTLHDADQHGQGLLGSAVLSGSREMLQLVGGLGPTGSYTAAAHGDHSCTVLLIAVPLEQELQLVMRRPAV